MPTPSSKRFNFFPRVVKTERKGVVKEVKNGQSAVGIVTDSIVYPLCPLRNTQTALGVLQRKNSTIRGETRCCRISRLLDVIYTPFLELSLMEWDVPDAILELQNRLVE
ncbi:hypothetical protein TNIN_353291 [Trichonephila inaurata madagascariensis]|uniref:Uncharacterized protein n=1 Tax=Trichonephila inaurata madagascariensis TaxID=2747483 RepID=A0A8X7BYY3_9ARAC|nr:hypothetical protein TNIN_353291 [Trichonephila inaurata madagascariensis]